MHVVKVTKKQNIIVNDGFHQFKAKAVYSSTCTGCVLWPDSTRDASVCSDVPCAARDRRDGRSVAFIENL